MSKVLVGYVRVAPREKSDERPSLDLQRDELTRAAAEGGWTLLRIDEDVRSGRTLRRPGLRAAVEACRAGDAAGIIVARLDRLTYSLSGLAELVRTAVDEDFTIISLDPSVDIASDGGRAVGEVLAEAASWQPRALDKPGRAMGGRAGRPSSTPAAVATRIRELRDQGMTLQAICDTLNAEQVPTPRGGSEWRPTSLRSVLRADAA